MRTALMTAAVVLSFVACRSDQASRTDTAARDDNAVVAPPARADAPAGARDERMEPAGTAQREEMAGDRERADEVGPLDQENSDPGLSVTQEIRQALMRDDQLSFSAKNIQVITEDRTVTLKGEVDSQREKEVILRHARALAGTMTVTDALTVK